MRQAADDCQVGLALLHQKAGGSLATDHCRPVWSLFPRRFWASPIESQTTTTYAVAKFAEHVLL